MAKNTCKCNWSLSLLGLILLAAGFYFVVWGFLSQTSTALGNGAYNWTAALYYLIGVALMGFSKMAKGSSCGGCKVHIK